jgi:hypothetical protein
VIAYRATVDVPRWLLPSMPISVSFSRDFFIPRIFPFAVSMTFKASASQCRAVSRRTTSGSTAWILESWHSVSSCVHEVDFTMTLDERRGRVDSDCVQILPPIAASRTIASQRRRFALFGAEHSAW